MPTLAYASAPFQRYKYLLLPPSFPSLFLFFSILVLGFYTCQWGDIRDRVFASWKLPKWPLQLVFGSAGNFWKKVVLFSLASCHRVLWVLAIRSIWAGSPVMVLSSVEGPLFTTVCRPGWWPVEKSFCLVFAPQPWCFASLARCLCLSASLVFTQGCLRILMSCSMNVWITEVSHVLLLPLMPTVSVSRICLAASWCSIVTLTDGSCWLPASSPPFQK